MRTVVQRVSEASVRIDGQTTASIGHGLLVLLGIHVTDTPEQVTWMAQKVAKLRIFEDVEGKMNLSVSDVVGQILVVSQFTLYGDARKGNRPSFIDAARPELAVPLYEAFKKEVASASGCEVVAGVFGADMKVSLVNDGPVTIVIDS
jgi:D-tyrosyl-tRNA(Tyr) deacylase